MPEVIGIDHIYVTVSDLARSSQFYDQVLVDLLGFCRSDFQLNDEPHVNYFNRHFGFVLRPARVGATHDPYAPGLHHFCLRVDSVADVQEIAQRLRAVGVNATPAQLYAEYAEDYVATFFTDPDGLRLEITNYRQERRERHDNRE
jgi:catechol 2,3-dioxygenase-like lactoylglutathione lyase family enzyme